MTMQFEVACPDGSTDTGSLEGLIDPSGTCA